jgi:endoglucanase
MSSIAIVCRLAALVTTTIGLITLPVCSFGAVSYTGVNLAGAEFGESSLPGTYNTNYTYPTAGEVDYFLAKGMNTFRLPFRWERLQQSANGSLNAAELGRLNTFVNYATSRGAYVVLDPHNYARYFPSPGNIQGDPVRAIGSAAVPNSAFADFWSRVANQYKTNARVIFGLMNEPNSMPTEQWRDTANVAIAAIRDIGATNLILVSGNAWTGAHSWTQNWYGTPNAQAMLNIVDPQNNFAFDVHQYLDSNSSGGSTEIVSPTIGQERLVSFTNWLHANNRRGFLGEFAVANSRIGTGATQIGDEAVNNMLSYVEANDDVWLGWTWWAAGPWWGNYMFTLEPTNLGQPTQADRPAMAVLQPHFATDVAGDYNDDGSVDAADYVVWRNTLNQNVPVGSGADGDGNSIIQEADYAFWQANFGHKAIGSSTEASMAIPEPAAASLGAIASAILMTLHRRRRQPSFA